MSVDELDNVADSLIVVFVLFHKYVMRTGSAKAQNELGRYHHEVLFLLDDVGPLPMSKIGEALYVSKPYVTSLVDKLAGIGLVKRMPAETDRRVINIALTDQGNLFLEQHKQVLRRNIKAKLVNLSDPEIEELAVSLLKLRRIMPRINS